MTKPSLEPTDDGDESSLGSDGSNVELNAHVPVLSSTSRSTSRSTRPASLNWKHSNIRNGRQSHHTETNSITSSSFPPSPGTVMVKARAQESHASSRRGAWSISYLCLITAGVGITLLLLILRSLVTHQVENKGCRMSYMRPGYVHFSDFDTEHTRFATKYSLYLYREQGLDDDNKLHGTPVLFIPGNAGSYKQVRPIAAEAANYFHNELEHDGESVNSGVRNLDFFTVDFNEDITAFHGQTLLDQAEYLNEAIRYILSLYSDPNRTSRGSHLPDPSSVIILGHSMGGVVARAMLIQPNYQSNSINTIITMSAPHARAPVTFDGQIVQIYDEINDYWRHAYAQKWANDNPLWHVTLVSIAGGTLDTVVPSDYASLDSLVPETHGFTVFTTGIPTVWTSMDHQAILWCDQFRKVVSQTLYDIVDVHRASQTKPRADRMRILRKRLLTGMEIAAEKTLAQTDATTLLLLDDESTHMVAAGGRLAISRSGPQMKPKAYLLPIPPLESPGHKRLTLLTDSVLDGPEDLRTFQVLLCSVLPFQGGLGISSFTTTLSFSKNDGDSTKLVCRDPTSDRILLPASTSNTRNPFYLDGEEQIHPFSYLQYDLETISEHQFVAVLDKAASPSSTFAMAEFSDLSAYKRTEDASLGMLLMSGLHIELPATRPMSVEVSIPALDSGILSFNVDVSKASCQGTTDMFAPLIRQYQNRLHESRYFVNANHVGFSLHGNAPYLPPSTAPQLDQGFVLQLWSDPTCESPVHITIEFDILGSLGKLYMRYRTVFAAFPLLIVTLVLRKQFRVYDETGIFITFSDSLDRSLRQSIPLLVLSLTLLSLSFGAPSSPSWWITSLSPLGGSKRNDLLIGTDDPVFCVLVPVIAVVCIGVCAILHYLMLGLTRGLELLYGAFNSISSMLAGSDHHKTSSPMFASTTPRRRMISTAILLFLVSTFIPYQFAYLVACLVQLFTAVRALRIYSITSSPANANYYHYSHSILLLMMWVLPINLPILAVWIRNLAVHWLTPFSSHHNVLSIMPFILLVENLTTGKMIPQKTNSLRHVTSVLLFATALCAAIYGVSYAYMLHYLVNIVAAWLVIIHSTSDPWSLTGLGAMFEGNASEVRKGGKSP